MNHMPVSNKKPAFFLIILVLFLVASCAKKERVLIPVNKEKGMASWYGPGFHGRKTANGERFNQRAMTAAHKKLPFNTWVKVVNRDNDKSVIVRINDRGPFRPGRIIDVSKKAARELDMLGSGTAEVIIFYLKDEPIEAGDVVKEGV